MTLLLTAITGCPSTRQRFYGGPSNFEGVNDIIMANTPAEIQLIRRAQAGDRDAFSSLYETHRRKVYSICLRITREPSEAEDCAQEAFLQCFLRLSTFRGDSALSTWLYRLTVNVVLMRLRSNHNRPLSVELAPTGDNTGEVSYLNLLPVEDLHLSGAIDRIALGRALRRLPHGYRTIFLLHDVEGMAHSEIARKLGCTIGNSKSQLHQARLRLRRFLRRSTLTRHPRQAATAAIRRRSSKNLRQNEIPPSIANEIPWIPAPEIPTESTART
jgi:RNA polymerase sigma-70 factor, ECF subfamily